MAIAYACKCGRRFKIKEYMQLEISSSGQGRICYYCGSEIKLDDKIVEM